MWKQDDWTLASCTIVETLDWVGVYRSKLWIMVIGTGNAMTCLSSPPLKCNLEWPFLHCQWFPDLIVSPRVSTIHDLYSKIYRQLTWRANAHHEEPCNMDDVQRGKTFSTYIHCRWYLCQSACMYRRLTMLLDEWCHSCCHRIDKGGVESDVKQSFYDTMCQLPTQYS